MSLKNQLAFEAELARRGIDVSDQRLNHGYSSPEMNAVYLVFLAGMEHALVLMQRGQRMESSHANP